MAITTLHLAVATFTMDIYRTDGAIWSQTETTTAWHDHSSGTAYRQTAVTNSPESFTNVVSTFHNQLNVSLDNLVSAFNTASDIRDCSELQEHTPADIPYLDVFIQELVRTTWELYAQFYTLMNSALWFICTGNTNVGHDVISMARIYVHNFTEFMVRLNGNTAAIGEEAVIDTVADLYRTSIQHVESVMELVEHLTEMIVEEKKMYAMILSTLQQLKAVNVFYKSSALKITVEKGKELVSLIQNISERAGNMSEHTDGNPFINVVTSGMISRFHNAQYWAKLLEKQTHVLVTYEIWLHEVQHIQFMMYQVTPVIVAIVLVLGITGNGLLLTIFVRYKETRTLANSMLINLTVVDFLSLVVNMLLEYLRVITRWQFGWLGCKHFFFLNYLLLAASTYSVTMISLQRFVAVTQLPSLAWCHQSQKTKYVLIATVWCIGCILSVPHAVAASSKNGECIEVSYEYMVHIYTADLIVFCAVPLIFITVFSVLTAYRIRRSVREIPGEATGQQQLKHSRMVSSTVLFALTVVFVVSYAPFFLFKFLIFGVGISVTNWNFTLVNVLTYCLRFVNCCLNPMVLFVMIKRYRGYIKSYCGKREVQPAITVEAVSPRCRNPITESST